MEFGLLTLVGDTVGFAVRDLEEQVEMGKMALQQKFEDVDGVLAARAT